MANMMSRWREKYKKLGRMSLEMKRSFLKTSDLESIGYQR